jgi:hypothetical protein
VCQAATDSATVPVPSLPDFTPTGSSWINQVERWFGFLTDQMIRRGAHKNVQALEADIRAWIKNWNDDPKPFIWTKTAEEILDSQLSPASADGFQAQHTSGVAIRRVAPPRMGSAAGDAAQARGTR